MGYRQAMERADILPERQCLSEMFVGGARLAWPVQGGA